MILICANKIAGTTGYAKSVVELANGLHRAGYPVTLLSVLGPGDGSQLMLPSWPLDRGIPALPLQTLAADGGRMLHRNYHTAFTARLGAQSYPFTANQLEALRELNSMLTSDDTILFTSPIAAGVFHHALAGAPHRAKTVLQIHNDYHFHEGLWASLMESRASIDRLQTVSSGLRDQFIPTFADDDVVFVPNFPGAPSSEIERVQHDGIDIALPASFQERKNQLDAVRALSMIDDASVRLTLWGNNDRRNPYLGAVLRLVESLGLQDRVRIPGFGTEADMYSTADVVLMTSLSEGLPFPLIEAASHGVPTVTYDFDFGPRDAVIDGESGFIVPVGDVDGLSRRLALLAADERLRTRFGQRSRQLYDERFAESTVADRYRDLLGPEHGTTSNLVQAFATEGTDPIPFGAVSHRARRWRGRRSHEVTIRSPRDAYDFQIDDGSRVTTPASVLRSRDAVRLRFDSGGAEVISYAPIAEPADRHYLANITVSGEFEELPYLRRGANYGDGVPPVIDTLFVDSRATRRTTVRILIATLAPLARAAVHAVGPAVRRRGASGGAQVSGGTAQSRSAQVVADSTPSAAARAAAPAAAPATGSGAAARGIRMPIARVRSLGRAVSATGAKAKELVYARLATGVPTPSRREVARHPWFPVTAGTDGFGAEINQPGGVVVRNTGSVRRPAVSLEGEYDWVVLRDAAGERTVAAPFSYGELFDRICVAERDFGLFDITTAGGIHPWELDRSAVIVQLAEAAGLWGSLRAGAPSGTDIAVASRPFATAPAARRVVFDSTIPHERGRGIRVEGDVRTLLVVQSDADIDPGVDGADFVYSLDEFHRWRHDRRRRSAQLRVPDVDVRPFEEALSDALGIRVDIGDHLRRSLGRFMDEREFFAPVFERVGPTEVTIGARNWPAGIAAAAALSGAKVIAAQDAPTSRYTPSFWLGTTPHYGADCLLAWSEYWAARTNAFPRHTVVSRQNSQFRAAVGEAEHVQSWDVCVICEPRVLRRIIAFLQRLVQERPDLRVAVAPHSDRHPIPTERLAAADLLGRVSVVPGDALSTIRRSAVCVGAFSTSLWEAAALGRPTYVLPVPGHEMALQDIESGLFRLANSPHDLVAYDVPEIRSAIFGE